LYKKNLTAHHYFFIGDALISDKLPFFDLVLDSQLPDLMLDYNIKPSIVAMKVKVHGGLSITLGDYGTNEDLRFDFVIKDLTTMGT
jgi:hypothetical protein